MAAELANPTTKMLRLDGGRASRLLGLLWWTPVALSVAYLLTLIFQFNQLVATTYLDADAASAPVIGELFRSGAAHQQVVLGQMAWFSTLMFELGTRWLPLHRQIWEAVPYAMALASVALIGWGAWRVAGRWAGAISAAILVCAAPHTLHLLFSLNDHSPTWFTLALLAAFLVLLQGRADTVTVLLPCGLAVVVGAVLGANMASDSLLVVAGVVPFLLAAAGAWVLHPDRRTGRAGAFALATVLVAVATDVLVRALMQHKNVISAVSGPEVLATGDTIASNFKLWWQSIAVLGNGDFFGQALGFSVGLAVACAGMVLLAVLLVPRIAWRELARMPAARLRRPAEPARTARVAWSIFWATSLVLLSFGFILSTKPVNIESDRYLVGLIYAAAALIPLLGTRSLPARAAVTAAVTLFAFTGWLSLAQEKLLASSASFPSDRLAGAIARIAKEEHLTVGYAGYWDAAPITWATHMQVEVYPVIDCPGGKNLCRFWLHYINTWYTPRPATRTFLISDPGQPIPATPTPDLGSPVAVHQIAAATGTVTMYVYPYDIAARLQ
jgi:hypothetical protein